MDVSHAEGWHSSQLETVVESVQKCKDSGANGYRERKDFTKREIRSAPHDSNRGSDSALVGATLDLEIISVDDLPGMTRYRIAWRHQSFHGVSSKAPNQRGILIFLSSGSFW